MEQPTEQTTDLAIRWFVRLRADDVREYERKSFFAWLSEAPAHQQAFLEIAHLWSDLAVIKEMSFQELQQCPVILEFRTRRNHLRLAT